MKPRITRISRKSILIFLFSTFPFFLTYTLSLTKAVYAGEDYFSRGIEQYLKGDLSGAIGSLEKAVKAEPKNEEIEKLLVRLLLEAAGRSYEEQNLNKAISYLARARELAPENKEVQELYSLIQEELHLSTAPISVRLKDEEKKVGYKEAIAKARESKRLREAEKRKTTHPRKPIERRKKKPSKPSPPKKPTAAIPKKVIEPLKKEVSHTLLFGIIGFGLAGGLLVFGGLFILNQRNKILQLRLETEREEKAVAQQQLVALEEKQRQAEVKKKQEEEKLKRQELELREEKVVEEEKRVPAKIDKQKEDFVRQQTVLLRTLRKQSRRGYTTRRAKFDDPTLPQELPDERLLKTTLDLYEINPELSLETLRKMTKSEDKWERLQAVWILGELPTMDGAQIIMDLWNDADQHVKRGVIKTLNKLDKIYEFPQPLHARIQEELNKAKTEEKWIF